MRKKEDEVQQSGGCWVHRACEGVRECIKAVEQNSLARTEFQVVNFVENVRIWRVAGCVQSSHYPSSPMPGLSPILYSSQPCVR